MIINRRDNISELKKIFSKVFINNDPFGRMFNSSISEKIILYPTDGYYLSKKQFFALINTMRILGETTFFLSEIEGKVFFNESTSDQHLEFSIDTQYAEYERNIIIFENALYSTQGAWGILISHEQHAVLGGHKEFMEVFKRFYPDFMKDQINFIKYFEYWAKYSKTDLTWVSDYIKYINN